MKFCWALLLLTSAALRIRPSSAEGETKYFEEKTTLTLEPDVSTVPQSFTSIRWKHGTDLVVDWDSPSVFTYFGSFKGRTTLDPQTLRLVINPLTLADSNQFSLETNLGRVGTYEVKVIKAPLTPNIKTQPLVCEVPCALKCTVDTTDLGPVSYEWKERRQKEGKWEEGPWTKGEELKSINKSETREKFSCKLKTRVRPSAASDFFLNPLELAQHPTPLHPTPLHPTPLSPGAIAGIIIAILVVVVFAVLITMGFMYPKHPFTIQLMNFIPWYKPAGGASEANNRKKDDEDKEAANPCLDEPALEIMNNIMDGIMND